MKKSVNAALCARALGAIIVSFSPLAYSQTDPLASQSTQGVVTLPGVTVTDRPVSKSELTDDPAANAASVTVIKFPDEQKRNLRDYTELFKPIMGVSANNFDQGGIGFEGGVDLTHLAGNRAEELGDGFHGLDGTEGLMGCKMGAYFRKIDEDHVTQLALRVVGDSDAYDTGVVRTGDVLMLSGIEQLLGHA